MDSRELNMKKLDEQVKANSPIFKSMDAKAKDEADKVDLETLQKERAPLPEKPKPEEKVKDATYTYSDINKIKDAFKNKKVKTVSDAVSVAKSLGYDVKVSGTTLKLKDEKGIWVMGMFSDKKSWWAEREANAQFDSKPLTADSVISAMNAFVKVTDANEYRGTGQNITQQTVNSILYNILETARRSDKKAEVKSAVQEAKGILKKFPNGGDENTVRFSTIKSKLAEAEKKFNTMN